MADLQIENELAAALQQLATNENLSVEALLKTLLQSYRMAKHNELFAAPTTNEGWHEEALDSFIGMFDDDVHELSESVHESVTNALRKKDGRLS